MIVARHRIRCAIAAVLIASSSIAPVRSLPMSDDSRSAAYFHEARLRKLHLVRPDLISYPVSFDIVC